MNFKMNFTDTSVMKISVLCLILGAVGIANMWVAIFADVGVMLIAILNSAWVSKYTA